MSINARRASYNALDAITREGAYTSFALKKHIPNNLSIEDKKFSSLIVRTTLENLLRIDFALKGFIKAGRVHGSVCNVLRLGACQILYLDVEDYAAVSESVKLIKKIKPQMSGFVNGVLRALVRGKQDIEYPQGKNALALSIEYSYPLWICEKYISDFGYEFTYALFSHKAEKGTCVRMNTIKTDANAFVLELNKLGLDYTKGKVKNSYIIKGMTGIENTQIFSKGWIAVQAESAMKAVIQTGIRKGDKLLDCCAAPGGKSAYAAALSQNNLDIIAWDIHEHRVEMTNKNYSRLGVKSAKAVLHDATVPMPLLVNAFDIVMADAPCSAMGLMMRNADIRYSRSRNDIEELSKKQLEILTVCGKYVKAGGTLAYYTCSINKEENKDVTDKFLDENNGFKYKEKPQTLYPHIDNSDGFYIAVMKRVT